MPDIFSKGPIKYNSTKWWDSKINRALEDRKQHSKENRWNDIEDYWNHEGEAFSEDLPSFNMVYMYGRSLIPSVAFKRPVIINTPRQRGIDHAMHALYMPVASIYDSIDALLMDEMEAEDVFKDAVLFSFLYNIAPVEIGMDFPQLPDVSADDFLAASLRNQGGFEAIRGQTDRARRQNWPWLDLVPPRQFITENYTWNQRKLGWYAKAVFVPTRILKKDSSLNQKNVEPTHLPEQLFNDQFRKVMEEQSGIEPMTLIYEVHEAEEGTMQWMTANKKPLFEPTEDPMQIDGLPIELLMFNRNPRSIWGTPDVLYIEPQMLDGNETRRLGLLQKRLALLKIIVNGNLDENEIDKIFEEGIAVLRANELPANQNLDNVLKVLQPHVQAEFWQYQEKLIEDANRVIGMGPNQLGTFAPGRRTKFEAQEVAFNNDVRTDERRHMLGELIGRTFRKLNQVVTQYWTAPILVRVIGVDGARYFVNVKPTDLKTEMNTTVDVDTMVPRSREREKEEMMQVLQLLGQLPNANIFPLIRKLLSRFPWAEVDAYLPQAQQADVMSQDQFVQQQQGLIQGGSGSNSLGSTARKNIGPLVEAGKLI